MSERGIGEAIGAVALLGGLGFGYFVLGPLYEKLRLWLFHRSAE